MNHSDPDQELELLNISLKQSQETINEITKIKELRLKVELSNDNKELDKLGEEIEKVKHRITRTRQRNKRIDLFGVRKTII